MFVLSVRAYKCPVQLIIFSEWSDVFADSEDSLGMLMLRFRDIIVAQNIKESKTQQLC